jgi:signal transduction histidine kinase
MGFVLSISLIAASVLAIHIHHNNVNHQMERLVSGDNTPLFALGGFVLGIALLLVTIYYREKVEAKRIQALADYLEQINTGCASILTALGEDKFSKLEDEIYKTVTHLLQTKEAAVQAKRNFARNLENIAHQLKTPITALSLTLQAIRNISDAKQNY